MADRECRRGWILAPSPTDGKDVPFFVYVRDKEIVWDINNISKELNELSLLGSNREVFYPTCQWKFRINDWIVTLNQDATYTATRKLSLPQVLSYINESTLSGNTTLPFETMNDEYFNIQCTLMSIDNDITSSTISVIPESEEVIRRVGLTLRNTAVIFSDEFVTSGEYSNSYICITTTGKVKLQ